MAIKTLAAIQEVERDCRANFTGPSSLFDRPPMESPMKTPITMPRMVTDQPPNKKTTTPPRRPYIRPDLIFVFIFTSGFLAYLLTQQTSWAENQDQHQDGKYPKICPAGVHVTVAERCQQADKEASQHGASDVADA